MHVSSSLMSSDATLGAAFKAYDIRALSPETIDSAFARRLGKAIAVEFGPKKVLVGRDMRTTSFSLESALIDGLLFSGVHVVRIGLCSTPMFNVLLGLAHGAFDLGVMVTASHNPGKYNGFKIAHGDCAPVGEGAGMEQLRDAFLASKERKAEHMGSVTDESTSLDRYVAHIIELAGLPDNMPKMRIAIDAGNGMAGAVLPRLLSHLSWLDVVPLYFDPDGRFPNHEANPIKAETLTRLKEIVVKDNCVMGVAFDGDADRVGFVDETGTQISGDLITAFLAQEILREHPGGLVHYDVRSSWMVSEAIADAGGRSEMCKVGHANIKRLMRKTDAVFAGEVSMHFYFQELWNCESGDLAMLLMLRRMASKTQPLSMLWKPLQRYVHSGELNFEVKDKDAVLERIKTKYLADATKVSMIDGLRLEYRTTGMPSQDWWFNVRSSNTEPLLRLNVEARSEEVLQEHVNELKELIQSA